MNSTLMRDVDARPHRAPSFTTEAPRAQTEETRERSGGKTKQWIARRTPPLRFSVSLSPSLALCASRCSRCLCGEVNPPHTGTPCHATGGAR